MPTLSDKELEEWLTAAGRSLVQPPSSLDELLPLLDRIEALLSEVEQSPTITLQTALSPLMKALVVEKLLKHSNVGVKVGVASCISQIIRITAPDAPYDDDKLKDVFQLIVSSFEDLSDKFSRSYGKRATILENMAKTRSCVIMLDIECDRMIIQMFQHFLKAIRSYHAEIIFESMETIMTLILKESDDISPELLTPILATLKMNNKAVKPIAKQLAERVILSLADKLGPYLRRAVKFLDTSLDDYSEVVASVCKENTDNVAHCNESILNDKPSTGVLIDVMADPRARPPEGELLTLRNELHAAQIREKQLCVSNNKLIEETRVARATQRSLENRIRALEVKNKKVEEQLRLVGTGCSEARQEGFDKGYKILLSTEQGKAYLRQFWEEEKAKFLKSREFLDHIQLAVFQYLNYGSDIAVKQARDEGFTEQFDKDVAIDVASELEGWEVVHHPS